MSDTPEEKQEIETAGKRYDHALVSVSNPQTADQLLRLACLLTDRSSALHVMNVTREAPFPERVSSWRRSSQLVMDMTHLANRLGRVAKPRATTARSIPKAIVSAVSEVEADLLLMGWFGRVTPLAVKKSRVVNKVLHRAGCDTVVFKSRGELSDVKRVVVPVGGEMNEERIGLVQTFLQQWPVDVVVVHVLTPDSTMEEEDARELLQDPVKRLGRGAEPRIVRASNMVEGTLQVTEENDLLVLGPGREWVFGSFLFGRHADELTNKAPCSVIMFKSAEQIVTAWVRGLFKAIGRWFTGSSS